MMRRRFADVYHHARGRELTVVRPPRQRLDRCATTTITTTTTTTTAIIQSTLSQLFKPIKYAAIFSY